ncbi:thiol-disulfide oxidoreductase ResA [Bacillus timonensis]|nr:thiol-disulfide oxidoreductase ResA [Bacillus timonensis]
MKKKRLIIRTTILFLLLSAVGYTLYSNFFVSKEKIVIGKEAPNFVITDLNGNKHTLSDYRGKGVFLNFWGTWCKPCEREMPHMNKLYQVYKDKGVEIIAVNVNEPKFSVEKFVEKYDLTFPIGIDKGDQLLHAYGIDPLPTTFLINEDGIVVEIITGEMNEPMIKKYMDQITPK